MDVFEVVYARELTARVFRPGASELVVVDVHGGSWSAGDRMHDETFNRALAESGVTVVAVDFRQGPAFKHPAASEDVAEAVHWARLTFEPASVVLVGSSSGGHVALYAALREGADVGGVASLWAPADPLARYRFASALAPTSGYYRTLVRLMDGYYRDQDAMAQASIPRLLDAGEAVSRPRVWVVEAEHDENVPAEITASLVAACRRAGLDVKHRLFQGERHGFPLRGSTSTEPFVRELIETVLWLGAPPD